MICFSLLVQMKACKFKRCKSLVPIIQQLGDERFDDRKVSQNFYQKIMIEQVSHN